jgi:hypothetical protein
MGIHGGLRPIFYILNRQKMKQLLTAAWVLFALYGCKQEPEAKAKQSVKTFMDTTLHDAKSYESVGWGKIEKLYPFDLHEKQYDSLKAIADSLKDAYPKYEVMSAERDRLFNAYLEANSEIQRVLKLPITEDTTKPQIGWKISHKYRAKNKMGGLTISDHVFRLNMALDTVYGKY